MSEWKPIDTAPKDGTRFQAWLTDDAGGGFWEPYCRFHPESEAFEIWGRVDYDMDDWDSDIRCKPIAWMPEPLPPPLEDRK